jgi:hypothetical protein
MTFMSNRLVSPSHPITRTVPGFPGFSCKILKTESKGTTKGRRRESTVDPPFIFLKGPRGGSWIILGWLLFFFFILVLVASLVFSLRLQYILKRREDANRILLVFIVASVPSTSSRLSSMVPSRLIHSSKCCS